MSKKTAFTTITPLPPGITRETVLLTLHSHTEMIDLNPSHEERHPIKAPRDAKADEYYCQLYELTDSVSYLPAGMAKGKVSFKACFHNLANGMQTHVYAPMGLDIQQKWTCCGTLPGEPSEPVEIGLGAPSSGLYVRMDAEIKCNFLMTKFVKKTLKDSLATLVERLLVKSQMVEAMTTNRRLTYNPAAPNSPYPPSLGFASPPNSPPLPHAMPSPAMTMNSMSQPGSAGLYSDFHSQQTSPGYPPAQLQPPASEQKLAYEQFMQGHRQLHNNVHEIGGGGGGGGNEPMNNVFEMPTPQTYGPQPGQGQKSPANPHDSHPSGYAELA